MKDIVSSLYVHMYMHMYMYISINNSSLLCCCIPLCCLAFLITSKDTWHFNVTYQVSYTLFSFAFTNLTVVL